MKKNTKLILIVIAIILLLILGFGALVFLDYKGWINLPGNPVSNYFAERSAEESLETAIESESGEDADVDIDTENESVSIETEDGNFYSSTADSWPSDIPSDVPEFTAGQVTYKVKTEYDEGTAWIITIEETENTDVSTYKTLVESEGYELIGDINMAGTRVLNLSKGVFSIVITHDGTEGTTSVEVVQEN